MYIPFEQYKEMPELNWSKLCLVMESDRSYIRQKDKGITDTEAMKFGRDFHTFMLENELFEDTFSVKETILIEEILDPKNPKHREELEKLVNNGKPLSLKIKSNREMVEAYVEENQPTVRVPLSMHNEAHKRYIEENNIQFISTYDLYRFQQMNLSLGENGLKLPELREQTFLGKINNLDVKVRIDYLDNEYGGDLKTIKNGVVTNERSLYYHILNSKYHLQALYYMIVARQNGYNITEWYLNFVEKEEPFNSRTVKLDYNHLYKNYYNVIFELTDKVKMINAGLSMNLPNISFELLER